MPKQPAQVTSEGMCEVSRCGRKLWVAGAVGGGGNFEGCRMHLEEPKLRWVCSHNELCSLLHFFISVCWLPAVKVPDLTGEIIRNRIESPKMSFLGWPVGLATLLHPDQSCTVMNMGE